MVSGLEKIKVSKKTNASLAAMPEDQRRAVALELRGFLNAGCLLTEQDVINTMHCVMDRFADYSTCDLSGFLPTNDRL